MTGMLEQLLPADARARLAESGAAEHSLSLDGGERFAVVAARGGDDIWIEIRRRGRQHVAEPRRSARRPIAPACSSISGAKALTRRRSNGWHRANRPNRPTGQ
jgi:hypothetical protein